MIRLFNTLFILFTISFCTFAQVPTKGLVGYWPFNGNANDLSGFKNNGVVSGASLNTDIFGKDSSAYYFNGYQDYIKVPHSKSLNITGSYTISVWINPQNFGDTVSQGFGRIIDKTAYRLYLNKEGINLGSYSYTPHSLVNSIGKSGTLYPSNSDSYSLALKVWQHVAVSVNLNGSTNKCDFYLNGNYVASNVTTTLPTNFDSSTEDLYIGNRKSFGRAFKGKIDELRIYNRALSASEINQIYKKDITITKYDTIRVKITKYDTIHHIDTIKLNTTDTLFIKLKPTILASNQISFGHIIKVYPNPTVDQINIDFGSSYTKLSKYSIKITNTSGQTVYNSFVYKQNESIYLKTFTGKGLYYLTVFDENNKVIDVKEIVLQ